MKTLAILLTAALALAAASCGGQPTYGDAVDDMLGALCPRYVYCGVFVNVPGCEAGLKAEICSSDMIDCDEPYDGDTEACVAAINAGTECPVVLPSICMPM